METLGAILMVSFSLLILYIVLDAIHQSKKRD